MSDSWDDYASEWDSNPDVAEYARKAFRCLQEVYDFNSTAQSVVFDFGCGTGHLTARLSPLAGTVVSLDTSQKMIDGLVAKGLSNVIPICGTLSEQLDHDPARYRSRFDLVVASSVCGFLPDYPDALTHLRSLLKPSALFVQWDWLSSDESTGPGFTEERMRAALEAAGFGSVTVSEAFAMSGADGDMTVLMATARNET